jgi:hypothetical protein
MTSQTQTTLSAREVCRLFHVSKETCYANAEQLGGLRFNGSRRVLWPVGRVATVMGVTEERLLEMLANAKNGQGYA